MSRACYPICVYLKPWKHCINHMKTFKFSLVVGTHVHVWAGVLHEQKPALTLRHVCSESQLHRNASHLSGVRFSHGAKHACSNCLADWCLLPIAWKPQNSSQVISHACPVNFELCWIHCLHCCCRFIDLGISNVQKSFYPRSASSDLPAWLFVFPFSAHR